MFRTSVNALACSVALFCAGSLQAWAQDRGTPRSLKIGVVASSPVVAGASEIERAYSRALALPVSVFVARDFPTLIEAQVRSDIDYAIYSASAYAVAWKLCQCVEPIAAPVGIDGSHGVSAVLIRRKAAAAGAAAPIIDAGSVGALALMRLGREDDAAAPSTSHAATADMADAERRFIDRQEDALYGWALDRPVGGMDIGRGTFGRLVASGIDADDLEIARSSETLRFGPHTIRRDLPEGLKSRMRDFVTNMKLAYPDLYDFIETERQGGFVRVSHEDYLPALALVEKILGDEWPPRR